MEFNKSIGRTPNVEDDLKSYPMDKDVLTGVDEFDEFTEMPEFNRTANASTVLRKLLSNNGLNNLK